MKNVIESDVTYLDTSVKRLRKAKRCLNYMAMGVESVLGTTFGFKYSLSRHDEIGNNMSNMCIIATHVGRGGAALAACGWCCGVARGHVVA